MNNMKKNHTLIVLLIDRSGSMSSIKNDMEGGLKTFLDKQKKIEGTCVITASKFDHDYEKIYSFVDINQIEDIKIEPRGTTALRDSMNRLIHEVGEDLSNLDDSQKPEKILFVTITDGDENASKEITQEDLKKTIQHQTEKYNWEFVYIGANHDSFKTSHNIGITNSLNYVASSVGVDSMFQTLNLAISEYRTTSSQFNIENNE